MHYPTIDFLKGVGILLVLLVHTGTPVFLDLAVPILVFCMGMTGWLTYQHRTSILNYLDRKARRYLPAWSIMFLVSNIQNGGAGYGVWYYVFLFMLPSSGPGNYFLAVILQAVFVIPVLCYCYSRNPQITIFTSVCIQMVCWYTFPIFINIEPVITEVPITLYLFTLSAGIAVMDAVVTGVIPTINIFVFPVNQAGISSYHIFLIQIVYFCLPIDNVPVILSILFCIAAGYLFWQLDTVFQRNFM